jgi:hypothetical protein
MPVLLPSLNAERSFLSFGCIEQYGLANPFHKQHTDRALLVADANNAVSAVRKEHTNPLIRDSAF